MYSKKDILNQLKEFSHIQGKPVVVHTSLKSVGQIDGGGDTLLEALIEFFTCKGGLLCIPTHTWDSDVYDRREAKSCIGVLPMLAAAHTMGVRTLHPTHSMAVFGEKEKVENFISFEAVTNTPANPNGCLGKLYDEGGYVLLIGVGHTKNTFLHCVEEMIDVPNRLTSNMVEKTIIHKDGTYEKRYLHWYDTNKIPDVSVNFGKFEPAFRYHDCILDGFVGDAPAQLCNARKMKNVLELVYENNNYNELLDNNIALDEKLYKTL